MSDTYVQYISYRHITFWFDESNLMHNGNLTEFQRRKGKKEKEKKKKTYIAMQFTKKENESPISCSIRNAHLIPTTTLLFFFFFILWLRLEKKDIKKKIQTINLSSKQQFCGLIGWDGNLVKRLQH